ncbi:MAG TPA: hypothetical protein VJ276_03395, partial [Thermoanaerobaculia bacterium]|nr:hypothetical protein [Thermoanaerobaculia bacterium]
ILFVNMGAEGPPTRRLRRFDADTLEGKPSGFSGSAGGGAVYMVSESDDGEMLAHYLPWGRDAGYFIILNSNSVVRLMFTAALSGCAVGVVWGSDGSARVSHHNIQSGSITDDAAQRQTLMFTDAALHRSRYRIDMVESRSLNITAQGFAHVHGVRRTDGWHFYVQVMRVYKSGAGAAEYVIGEVGELRP